MTMASWSNLCITIARAELQISDVEIVRRNYELFAARMDKGFVSVVVALPGVGAPSEQARDAIPDLMRGVEKRVLAMVGILESTGFKAAAARSAMALMSMLSRTSYPRKIAANIQEAVPSIVEHVQPAATAAAVATAIEEAKAL